MEVHIVNTLRRIRQIISNSLRSYQSVQEVDLHQLDLASLNLGRISTGISVLTFTRLSEGINDLRSLAENPNGRYSFSYEAPRISTGRKGRPYVEITDEQLLLLYNEGFSAPQMAKQFGCSTSTIYKKMDGLHLHMRQRYTAISDNDLRDRISHIHEAHPNAGYVMMESYLRSEKINVPRKRVRTILAEVDPYGIASRWSKGIKRRIYSVPTPNSLWHIDAHLKLSRWGFVIHGAVDGYSRMIIYLKCETSIQPEPVLDEFIKGVRNFGLPSRVRSDHGFENILVAVLMNLIRGLNRGTHITGKSTHNQRIERLWVDVIKEVGDSIRADLYELENQTFLDPDKREDRFCAQYIYKSEINKKLDEFRSAWNLHKLRTEKHRTPRQLWLEGTLSNYNALRTPIREIFGELTDIGDRTVEALAHMGRNIINHEDAEIATSNFEAVIDLSDEQKIHLQQIKSRDTSPREKYLECLRYLNN